MVWVVLLKPLLISEEFKRKYAISQLNLEEIIVQLNSLEKRLYQKILGTHYYQ